MAPIGRFPPPRPRSGGPWCTDRSARVVRVPAKPAALWGVLRAMVVGQLGLSNGSGRRGRWSRPRRPDHVCPGGQAVATSIHTTVRRRSGRRTWGRPSRPVNQPRGVVVGGMRSQPQCGQGIGGLSSSSSLASVAFSRRYSSETSLWHSRHFICRISLVAVAPMEARRGRESESFPALQASLSVERLQSRALDPRHRSGAPG